MRAEEKRVYGVKAAFVAAALSLFSGNAGMAEKKCHAEPVEASGKQNTEKALRQAQGDKSLDEGKEKEPDKESAAAIARQMIKRMRDRWPEIQKDDRTHRAL